MFFLPLPLQNTIEAFDDLGMASQRYHIWAAYFPNNVDRSIPRDVGQRSLYVYFTNSHFEVVTAIRSR